MDLQDIQRLDEQYVLRTYARYPLALVKGRGCKVWDSDYNEYLDLIGGIASCPLGHSHPKFAQAVSEQVELLTHISNLFYIEGQAELAKMLNGLAPMKTKAFFCNSGAEANEAAIKFARKSTGKREMIAMTNSFHGRTMGTLAITDKEKYQKPFRPLMPHAGIVGYGDLEALEKAVTEDTAAVFVELIQGEAGIRMPRDTLGESIEYFKAVEELCRDRGVLMAVDEVQTGTGRTGTFFASEQFDIKPDIITTAKGIAGGFPMGATLVSESIGESIGPGDHASTFGGGPLACAAAKATVKTILEENLMDNARAMGKYLRRAVDFGDVRGLGLLRGMEVESEEKAKQAMAKMRERGVLVNVTGHNVIRMVPPLVISKEEIDFAVENLRGCVS